MSDSVPHETHAIEATYRRSDFVDEVCVLSSAELGESIATPYAVVVPNLALLRRKRIANIGDLLRFELEGRSIDLREEQRLRGYEVWFTPLPHDDAGNVDRAAIVRRVLTASHGTANGVLDLAAGKASAAIVDCICRRKRRGGVRLDANLEIDLGFDSLDRVELLHELECRYQTRLAADRTHEILTVRDVVNAFAGEASSASESVQPWPGVLQDQADVRRQFGWIVQNGGGGVAAFYTLLRLCRAVLPNVIVTGREHLPTRGPYIICPNHQSYVDPFFLSSSLPYQLVRQMFAVGAAEYFETRLTTWLSRQVRLVPVDPDANLVSAMRAAALGLQHGKILLLFPEGERSIDGRVKRFKRGAVVLSKYLNVPVVPCAMRGLYELWPRNRRINWRKVLPGSGHVIRIAFGAPMQFDSCPVAEGSALLQQRVSEMWDSLAPSPQPGRENGRSTSARGEQEHQLRAMRQQQQTRGR